jgi:hypothetical protein
LSNSDARKQSHAEQRDPRPAPFSGSPARQKSETQQHDQMLDRNEGMEHP